MAEACPTDLAPKPTFYDETETSYYNDATTGASWSSTKTAGSGVKATVVSQDGDNLLIEVTNP